MKVQGPNRTQNGVKIASKSHLRRGDPQNASREALGAYLEASGAEKKKLGTALCRFGTRKGAKMGGKWHPKTLQGACMRPRCSKKAPRGLWGSILTPFGSPQELKNSILHIKFPCFEGAPGAWQKHSARHPRAFQDILKQTCFVKSVPRYLSKWWDRKAQF